MKPISVVETLSILADDFKGKRDYKRPRLFKGNP